MNFQDSIEDYLIKTKGFSEEAGRPIPGDVPEKKYFKTINNIDIIIKINFSRELVNLRAVKRPTGEDLPLIPFRDINFHLVMESLNSHLTSVEQEVLRSIV